MSIMSRWHKPSCHSPKVYVEDELPCCESCGSSPNIQKLVSEQANLSTPWTVPPDEDFGEMNLSWPECVRYSPQPAGTNAGQAMKAGDMGLRDELSPIYHKRLQDDQFRLLYLPSVDDENHSIHASLEAYQTHDCPEYETVSYCWGGENDDTRLCKPLFLGDYWDILLQTQNCWSMLHYLRPRVGVHIIWVDAICINQIDHQERESQVAIMGNIYQQCLRAIVYLGQYVARPRSGDTRTYPERRDLNMASASAMDLHQLFKMRYFQRVWVVQELILAPMVVIPVHGVELTAGRRTATREGAWHESSAPWMSNICAGKSDTALGRILELTQNSQSTDLRDKVFGLLGFISGSTGLRPNYLLSSLHIYIGTIAHMLLNEGHSHLLIEAAGYRAPSETPSWLPDGNLSNLGALVQKLSNVRSKSSSSGLRGFHRSRAVVFWTRLREQNPLWETILLAKSDESLYGSGHPYRGFRPLMAPLPAPEKPSINPSTAALSLPLIYICQFSSKPLQIHWDRGLSRSFEITVSNSTLCICTSDTPLNSAIKPGLTSLFLLKDQKNPHFLLFMQRPHPKTNYRLLKCCLCYGIFLSAKPRSKSRYPVFRLPTVLQRLNGCQRSARDIPFEEDSIPILHYTVHSAVTEAENLCNNSWEKLQTMPTKIDPLSQNTVTGHILSLFHKLFISPEGPFVDLYFSYLRQCSPKCCVEVEQRGKEAWVWVTMAPTDWLPIHRALKAYWHEFVFRIVMRHSTLQHVGPWYWARVPGSSDSSDEEEMDVLEIKYTSPAHRLSAWTSSDTMFRRPARSWIQSRSVSMVAEMEGLRRWLMGSPYLVLFQTLRICSQLVKEDELTLATTGPKPEYKSVCYFDWPDCFFGGEHIPGKQENISIF